MSSLASKPAESTPAPPAFSYAQAAKGRSSSSGPSAILPSQAASGVNTPVKESRSLSNTPSASINGATGLEAGDPHTNGNQDSSTSKADIADGSDSKSKVSSNPNLLPTSPVLGAASNSTPPKEEDLALAGSASSESVWERNNQPANGVEPPVEASDGRRNKKGKKQKTAEKIVEKEVGKEREYVKQEVLVTAPVPTVNFWQQRQEAQAAKKPSIPVPQNSQVLHTNTSTSESLPGRSADTKKRAKSTAEDGDRTLSTAQNGVQKDSSNTSKGQKRGSDGLSRGKEDASKRAGPRGSRVSEKDEKSQATLLPPPVEDAISWPTPETALEEEKRKAHEKSEKEERDETAPNKPRSKEKWVPVPYIPSVTFNTPLPTRGGRGRGGARVGRESTGRGGNPTNGGASGDKANNSSAIANVGSELENREKSTTNSPRANSLPPNSTKKPSNDNRERKLAPTLAAEKSKSGQTNVASKAEMGPTPSSQAERSIEDQQSTQTARVDNSKKSDQTQNAFSEGHSKSSSTDCKGEPNLRGSEQVKDGNQARTDGRSDRGRGGFRGRGGHSNFVNGQSHPQHPFANGHGPQQPKGFPIRQNSIPYSPTIQQPPFTNQYAQSSVRGGRGGSRSQSIPNSAIYGRFPGSPLSLQPTNGMFDYQALQPMSATSYSSYNVDSYSLLAMVAMQLEYYFSIDNLCKDVYLRKHMDSQGFVFLSFIAGFKRIQALTQDFELLRHGCFESGVVDLVRGEDGIDRVRRMEGWEKWVLAMEERDDSVRNAGPSYHHRQPQRPLQMTQVMVPGNHGISPSTFSPNGTDSSFRPFGNGAVAAPVINGNSNSYHPETPLSAAVPDFAPGATSLNGIPESLEDETTFSDEQVAELTLVFNSPKGGDNSTSQSPFRNTSSRTFSDGSIDGTSIAEEMHENQRQGRPLTNGSHGAERSPDGVLRSRSPFAYLSPTKSTTSNAPPVMWVKGQKQQAPVSDDSPQEKYTDVRARALTNRESSAAGETHHDMKVLYEFWSHFLCRNFNPKMYSEFRQYAFEDARDNTFIGLGCLIPYYDEVLNNKKKVISDTLALHYVELVRFEKENCKPNGERPAFNKLRVSWRNGALDMRSRKKIDSLVDSKLKEELER